MPNCCVNCFSEPDIQEYVQAEETKGTCSYCDSTNVPIRDVQSVGQFIREGVEKSYEDAANQVTYDTAEGGYQMSTRTISEILLYNLDIFSRNLADPTRLVNDLIDEDGTAYVRRDPYGPRPGQPEEIYKWQQFSETIIKQQRFTAFLSTEKDRLDENHPARFLQYLADYLNSNDLIKKFSVGRAIYRARVIGAIKRFGHRDLTSAPPEKNRHNRMSPAGISFFYGCLEADTSIAEVRPNVGDRIAVAEFTVRHPLRLLDLSREVEERLSIFHDSYDFGYEEYFKPFLNHFAADITKPIRPFESDILYVPTQAFTEFIRVHQFRNSFVGQGEESTFRIDGILYRSSLRIGGINLVLFRGPEISTSRRQNIAEAWLQYERYRVYGLNGISYSANRV